MSATEASKRYFKLVKSLFPICGKEEKLFIGSLKTDVDEYIKSNPESDYDKLVVAFGEPKTVMSQYISDTDSDYLEKQIRTATIVKRCVLIIILLAVISSVIFGVINYRLYIEGKQHYIDREITEVVEEG
jgi:hypothetical protein